MVSDTSFRACWRSLDQYDSIFLMVVCVTQSKNIPFMQNDPFLWDCVKDELFSLLLYPSFFIFVFLIFKKYLSGYSLVEGKSICLGIEKTER